MAKRLPRTVSCPVELTLDVLSGKWKSVLLAHLKDEPLRYGELRRRVPKLSDKMLTERLHDLERLGLIRRREVFGRPHFQLYEMTESGNTLRPILEALYLWGETAARRFGIKVEMAEPVEQSVKRAEIGGL